MLAQRRGLAAALGTSLERVGGSRLPSSRNLPAADSASTEFDISAVTYGLDTLGHYAPGINTETPMRASFKSISPCDGWYYVGHSVMGRANIVYKIAAWGLTDNNEVFGLIPVTTSEHVVPGLELPPAIGGTYKSREQLTEEELAVADEG